MTYTLTVKTETATGTTTETRTATADTVNEVRAEIRANAPHGSTQTITVK